MTFFSGKHIKLRTLEPEDLDFLFWTENDESFWSVSNTTIPFSKYILKKYIENAHQDIFEAKQLRFVIQEIKNKNSVGLIDLFDFNPIHKRAGIGILILKAHQQKKYANEALQLLIKYAFYFLNLHQLYANIHPENSKSISLFTKHLFHKSAVKKEWNYNPKTKEFENEVLYQLLNSGK